MDEAAAIKAFLTTFQVGDATIRELETENKSLRLGLEAFKSQIERDIDRIKKLNSELTRLRAIVQRVHEECGPIAVSVDGPDGTRTFEVCQSCNENDCNGEINCKPDCLWLAADKALAVPGGSE